jgi:hypothetical protein
MSDDARRDVEIRRWLAESDKFVAEQRKLMAEASKLDSEKYKLLVEGLKLGSETRKFDRERWTSVVLAIGAALGALTGLVLVVGKLLGMQ